jgi:hypothetical protein
MEDEMAEDVVRIDKMKKCIQNFGRENWNAEVVIRLQAGRHRIRSRAV